MYHSEINSAYLALFGLTGYLSSASSSVRVGWVLVLLLWFGLVGFFPNALTCNLISHLCVCIYFVPVMWKVELC